MSDPDIDRFTNSYDQPSSRESVSASTPVSSYSSISVTSPSDVTALSSHPNPTRTITSNGGYTNPNFSEYVSPPTEVTIVGSTVGNSLPPATHHDKTPLLTNQSEFLRSIGDAISRPGLFDIDTYRFGLSTFSGVFCPVALSMLSVLLYLRLGFVVGQSGILVSLFILVLAYGIILFTALSLCAVSTNGAIEGGGVYYMISRALGPEFGGSIGVLFFIANIFSCALSLAGLSEVMISNFGPGGYMVNEKDKTLPDSETYQFLYSFTLSVLTLLICLIGASLFAKTSLITLIVVIITYVSFLMSLLIENHTEEIAIPRENKRFNATNLKFNYTGIRSATFSENLNPQWSQDYTTNVKMNFASVFGVVFSGVTGLMAGANMSGDLKKPNISIPKGTLQAIGATFLVYALTAVLLGASCTRELLLNDYTVIQNINVWPPFIFIGVFATSLASAMSNLIGASRILNRVAEDKLFGFILYPFLKRMCGNNPVNSVLLAWLMVVFVLLIGALNAIAQVTSVFFLLSYAGVNLACLALDLTSAPNFRPTFYYFTWHTAVLGFVGSVVMMFAINPGASGIAIISMLLILIGLHYRAPMPASWGSISQALIFHQVRKYLLMLDTRKEHVKFWRPQMLLLVANPKSCLQLIDFVNDLKKSGLYVLGHVKINQRPITEDLTNNSNSMDTLLPDPLLEETPYWLGLVDYLKIKAFVEITASSSVREGAQHLVRLSGLGAMKPNTVILGFHDRLHSAPNTFRDSKLFAPKGSASKLTKFAKLDRAEVVEYFTARDFSTASNSADVSVTATSAGGAGTLFLDSAMLDTVGQKHNLSTKEYVQIVADVLRMNKNICLARNFYKMDKLTLFTMGTGSTSDSSSRIEPYIDVWPVDLVRPQNASTSWDNSSLFLLQLACILSMVDDWKAKCTLRVFLCVTSLQDMQRKSLQLKEMLGQLRIKAKSILLPWDHVICHLNDNGPVPSTTDDVTKLPESYLRSFNDLLIKNSGRSAVLFLNMPLPPQVLANQMGENFTDQTEHMEKYLQCLETITEHLPPILLVHGISSVISTAL